VELPCACSSSVVLLFLILPLLTLCVIERLVGVATRSRLIACSWERKTRSDAESGAREFMSKGEKHQATIFGGRKEDRYSKLFDESGRNRKNNERKKHSEMDRLS
jgi:hypothetical protein